MFVGKVNAAFDLLSKDSSADIIITIDDETMKTLQQKHFRKY